uniref:DNA-directed RNA polymerase subunit n=1 Tax=Rhabditophanes sp. KR3021 TaxID=114890 RepID=A0AC35TWK5_9BILA
MPGISATPDLASADAFIKTKVKKDKVEAPSVSRQFSRAQTNISCILSDGKILAHGAERIPSNSVFIHSCLKGVDKIIGCIGSDRVNNSRIKVGETKIVNNFWHKCEPRRNGVVAYIEEDGCKVGGSYYHLGDPINLGFFRLTCTEAGYRIVGCYYLDDEGRQISMNGGDVITFKGKVHFCNHSGDKFHYHIENKGCFRDKMERNDGDEWNADNIIFKCLRGNIRIVGCYKDDIKMKVGENVIKSNMAYSCFRVGSQVHYTEYSCGLHNWPSCEMTAIEPPQIAIEIGNFRTSTLQNNDIAKILKMDWSRLFPDEFPYMKPNQLNFRIYTPHEIQKLSVFQVSQEKTFDALGHPIPGGLYDGRFGPQSDREECVSCGLNGANCPGHFGHITLDVPVFNPMLFALTYNLMKASCVHCHRFTCNTNTMPTQLVILQLKCIESGVDHVAEALMDKLNLGQDADAKKQKNLGAEDIHAIQQFDKMMLKEVEMLKSQGLHNLKPTKNGVAIKSEIITRYLRSLLFKRNVKCPLCKKRNGGLKNDQNKLIIIDFTHKSLKLESKTDKVDELEDITEEELKSSLVVGASGAKALEKQLEDVTSGRCSKLAWRAAEVREHFRLLWENEKDILVRLFPMFNGITDIDCALDLCFTEMVMVPPSKFRPTRMMKGEKFEHPETIAYRKLFEAGNIVSVLNMVATNAIESKEEVKNIFKHIDPLKGKTLGEKIHNAYLELQTRFNVVFNSDVITDSQSNGLKQLLEKKEGLFRMHMMGKRVNYACRSVITPDPYLDVDEIGIPLIFAKKLTFAEPVNSLNAIQMRKQVQNGPNKYPGANFVQLDNKFKQKILDTEESKTSLSKKLIPASAEHVQSSTVYRHLKEGDMLLMNRQPSLHKPSIMGHRTRILSSQKSIRMNYAPCKAYNADFDGDEMNGHFIQNIVGQTEARELVNVGTNFLVPKDGTPILGLIQDHVVSGVYMTVRGNFFKREDFMHLLLSAFGYCKKKLVMPPPVMIKPEVMWSGKQLVSAIILNNIPEDCPKINLAGKTKTPLNCWTVKGHAAPELNMSESEIVFRQGELLVGVLDKAHFGATQYGLIHCCYELYGHKVATSILSCFSRLFTTYLQFHGFTLGVSDILVTPQANKARAKHIKHLRKIGNECVKKTFNLDPNCTQLEIKHTLASAYNNPREDKGDVKQWDYAIKQELNKYNDKIGQSCVPSGLIKTFPENALQMMIQSGAKGSMVNAVQISCGLGQIELEGQRPPLTASGRTLPSFKEFDPSPRAGGYVDQRFLTGINPQELFFHTMAGREGLIDTAVKTSRSGYLQRCIIKHLESLKIAYDLTVRDSDNSIVQFKYGEDGMDIGKVCYMNKKQFGFMNENLKAVRKTYVPDGVREKDYNASKVQKAWKSYRARKPSSIKSYRSGFIEFSKTMKGEEKAKIVKAWSELCDEEKGDFEDASSSRYKDTPDVEFNCLRNLGALPETMVSNIESFTNGIANKNEADFVKRTLFWKGMQSYADPGENVGLLAAQSIGEPSTQMTLNTFHFAGRGEMNVTLGIPRLREILMTASKSISTPMCQINIIEGTSPQKLEAIRRELDRVYMKQVLKDFSLEESISISGEDSSRNYILKINLMGKKERESVVQHVSCKTILKTVESRFAKLIGQIIHKRYEAIRDDQSIRSSKLRGGNLAAGIIDEDVSASKGVTKKSAMDNDSDDECEHEMGADSAKIFKRHAEGEIDYEGEEAESAEVNKNAGGNLYEAESEEEDVAGSEDVEDSKENVAGHASRIEFVVGSHKTISNYSFDEKKNQWCEIRYKLPYDSKSKFDMFALVNQQIDGFIISETPGIEKCVFSEMTKNSINYPVLQTQGINLMALYKHGDVLDINSLYSNDINCMLQNYGCEAAGLVIAKEMNNVFSVYGIEVNPRHLALTADYMTYTGAISPFNRMAMNATPSPLQKITYETSLAFLRQSLIEGTTDTLESPSARLVVGQMMRSGTGFFDLIHNVKGVAPEEFMMESED